jgi:ABC-type Na+ efflux pump permease subunit
VPSPTSSYDIADVYQWCDRSVPVLESGCFAGYILSVQCPHQLLVMTLQMFISGGIVVSQFVSPGVWLLRTLGRVPSQLLVISLQKFIIGGIAVSQFLCLAVSLVTVSRYSVLANFLL